MIPLTTPLLPDVIVPTVAWLTQISEIVAVVGDRVGTETSGVWPAVRLDLTGGVSLFEQRLDTTRLQVHAFADDDQTAVLVARLVRAGLVQMEGHRTPNVMCVTNVDTSSPQLIQDNSRTPPVSHATFIATITSRNDP